jgi:hypothetical protein
MDILLKAIGIFLGVMVIAVAIDHIGDTWKNLPTRRDNMKKIVQEELEKQKAAQRQEEWEAEDLKKRNAALERIEKFKASRENDQSSTD